MTIAPLPQLTIVRQRLAERKPVYDVYRLWRRHGQPIVRFMNELMAREPKVQWWTKFARELARQGGVVMSVVQPADDWPQRLAQFIVDERFIATLQRRLTEAEQLAVAQWLLTLEDEWTYGRFRFSFQVSERTIHCGDYRISGAFIFLRRQAIARIAARYGRWSTFHARARREWLYLPDERIIFRFERELRTMLQEHRFCANYRALRSVVDFARHSLYATLAAKHRCSIRQWKRTMADRVFVWQSLVDSQSASRIR